MKYKILGAAVALAAFSVWSTPALSAPKPVESGSCIKPEWTPTSVETIGAYTVTCKTYFMFILVHTSTAPCQTSIRTTPGHFTCSDTLSTAVDCLGSVNAVIESTQKYKSDCKGATGLTVDIGGVKIGIDWWKAVCETDGPPVNVVKMTDSSIPCNKNGNDNTD